MNNPKPAPEHQQTQKLCADGHAWATHIRGGCPIDVRICGLCGVVDFDDLDRQVEEIREGIAQNLTAMRDKLAALTQRRKAIDLDDQACESAARSRAFGRAAEIARDSSTNGRSSDARPTLVEHARRELELLGEFESSPAYAQSIVAAVAAFASYGHSGGSAGVGREHLATLIDYRALSPLTSDPDEWEDRSDMSGTPWWQNRRDSRAMSHDGGETYWYVDDDSKAVHRSIQGGPWGK